MKGYISRSTSLGHLVIVEGTYTKLDGTAHHTPRLHGSPSLYMLFIVDQSIRRGAITMVWVP